MYSIIVLFVIISIILISLGGYYDITDSKATLYGYNITRYHLWADGTALLIGAMFIYLYKFHPKEK